jgi:hypothetical protein
MLVALWSVKGGVGVTVTSVIVAAAAATPPPLLVDLAGDLPACLGVDGVAGPGLADWSRTGSDARPDALARLVVSAGPAFDLLPRGRGPIVAARVPLLLQLAAAGRPLVVVDAGRGDLDPAARAAVQAADRSLLVVRSCVLGLARARQVLGEGPRPDGVVVVAEPDRALGVADVVAVLGVACAGVVPHDPAVARAVDAGVLDRRIPKAAGAAARTVLERLGPRAAAGDTVRSVDRFRARRNVGSGSVEARR